jgi:2-hydroxychromene-2-carboxylate isomerase
MSQTIEVWFEFASTYSYPGVHQLSRYEGVPFTYRPFLLGPIFAAQGWSTSPFNLQPAKGRYMWRDLERLCEAAGLPLQRPTQFPRNGLLAARVAVAHQGEAWIGEFIRRVYRANFAEDQDISSAEVLGPLLAALGCDPGEVLMRAESPATKQLLRDQTQRALELGIFGAPMFVVDGELFWGGDRLEQAVAWWKQRSAQDRSAG